MNSAGMEIKEFRASIEEIKEDPNLDEIEKQLLINQECEMFAMEASEIVVELLRDWDYFFDEALII